MSSDFQAQLEALRPHLLRYAAMELRNREAAEDCVQEALLAALSAPASFEGRSNLRTWLTGILKHKIVDHMRRQQREQPLLSGDDPDASEADAADALFAKDGHWRNFPASWGDPHRALENKKFWEVFEACAKRMPARTARVFTMREVLQLSTDEICKELGVTAIWVMPFQTSPCCDDGYDVSVDLNVQGAVTFDTFHGPLQPYGDSRVGGALIVVDPASHRTSGALLVRKV